MTNREKIKKVVYWRIMSLVVAGLISYGYLKEFKKSIELTVILTIVMTILLYFYEGYWEDKQEPN